MNGFCSNPDYADSACLTWRGGQYDLDASETHESIEAGSIPQEPNPDTLRFLDFSKDTIRLNDSTSLTEFPIGTVSRGSRDGSGHQPLSGIGLGVNSTILKALKDSGRIASRSWSMFYGWMGADPETQRDGTFVFGGYDRAKVSGSGLELPMTTGDCETRMMVTISDLVLNFPNGTEASLFPESKRTMLACVDPSYPVAISLPSKDFYQQLIDILGEDTITGTGLMYSGRVYKAGSKPYNGDLTMKLQSGLSIRIPNHQLVQPSRKINNSTGQLYNDGRGRVLAVKKLEGPNLPTLGKQFLAAAYLMVNEDTQNFTIWAAKPNDQQDLVAVGEDGTEATEFCDSNEGTTDQNEPPADSGGNGTLSEPENTGGTNQSGNSSTTESDGDLSKGAIAGIAVGVVAVVAIIAIVGFILYRRRRNKAAKAKGPQHYHELTEGRQQAPELTGSKIPPTYGKHELADSPIVLQELDNTAIQKHELS